MADDDQWDLTTWEKQTTDDYDSDSSEDRIQNEKERFKETLWSSFQNSASQVACLYRDGSGENRVSLWLPFRNAASAVTLLYKDGQDAMEKCFELGCQLGSRRRSKDYLKWLKTKKRKVPREEMIGYICGKNPPVRPRAVANPSRLSARHGDRSGVRIPTFQYKCVAEFRNGDVDELDTFRQAIAMHELDGAMSNFAIRSPSVSSSSENSCSASMRPGLDTIIEEINRRSEQRKRSAPSDSCLLIDSPSRKRSKLQ